MKITSQAKTIDGPCGNIQAVLDLPEVDCLDAVSQPSVISINCHPHSLHGGTLTNKVVHTVSRSIAALGIPSLRFNFRGVGESAGEYDEGVGEQQDLAAVVKWMQQQYPQTELIISGFSFGSFVSGFAATHIKPDLLLSIAPPVKRFDFSGFKPPTCPWFVIMGDADELVEYKNVVEWVDNFEKKPELITMKNASHFFHGRLIELREHVETIVADFVEKAQS